MDSATRERVSDIIMETIKKGTKSPGILQMGRALLIKKDLESSDSVTHVCTKLIHHKTELCSMFGLNLSDVYDCLASLMEECHLK